jgi:hypothetical protein
MMGSAVVFPSPRKLKKIDKVPVTADLLGRHLKKR